MSARNATFTTARPRLVSILLDNGFRPLSIGESPWNAAHSVWTFTRTPELNAIVGEFYAELKASPAGGAADA